MAIPQPTIFADFTSGANGGNYLFNGNNYTFSGWLTALGGTFSRASSGYYTNSSGLLTSAGNNVARFDYDPVALTPRGILLEAASTNLLLQSNVFSNATWVLGNGAGVSVAQNVTGPDGVANGAWTFTANGSGAVQAAQGGLSVAATSTASFFVKAGTLGFAYIQANSNANLSAQYFNVSTGTVGTTVGGGPVLSNPAIQAFPGGWYRISVSADSSAITIDIGLADADNNGRSATSGKTLLVFGGQFEQMMF